MKEITTKKKTTKKPSVVVKARETDEEAMTRFAREHPEYVQAELEHYWKREAELKGHWAGGESVESGRKKRRRCYWQGIVDVAVRGRTTPYVPIRMATNLSGSAR